MLNTSTINPTLTMAVIPVGFNTKSAAQIKKDRIMSGTYFLRSFFASNVARYVFALSAAASDMNCASRRSELLSLLSVNANTQIKQMISNMFVNCTTLLSISGIISGNLLNKKMQTARRSTK